MVKSQTSSEVNTMPTMIHKKNMIDTIIPLPFQGIAQNRSHSQHYSGALQYQSFFFGGGVVGETWVGERLQKGFNSRVHLPK